MKSQSQTRAGQALKIMYIFAWILFIGLSIEAGGFVVNAIFAVAKPAVMPLLWHEADLSALFAYSRWLYFAQLLIMTAAAIIKAHLFYLIVMMLHDKKLNLIQPFNHEVGRFIFKMSYLSLAIGVFSWLGVKYAGWLATMGVQMPDIQSMRLGGADVWLFMSVTLFVIAQIFQRGIELQEENDLTV